MLYRKLETFELERIREIDRSEVINRIYYHRGGQLELVDEHYNMKGFPPGELDSIIQRQAQLQKEGGVLWGAFDDYKLVGITSIEGKLRRDAIKMDILFVSKDYRGKGIAKNLTQHMLKQAKKMGATKLYISATPSENTVSFYRSMGCELASELDPELYELEPEDIHLQLSLDRAHDL